MNIDEILRRSRYYPSEAEFVRHNSSSRDLCPINPRDFTFCNETFYIIYPAKDAFEHIRKMTDVEQREYSIVFSGVRKGNFITITDYYYSEGKRAGVLFTIEQREFIKESLKQKGAEVIYGHTHVASGSWYNYFSLNDLRYIVKNAVLFNRNTYGMLITKDTTYLIKYDIKEHEFYRVGLNV